MPASAMAMNIQRKVSRYGTSGRIAPWVSVSTSCATSTPAVPIVATPAALPPFRVRLSANTSRAGGLSAAKADARFGNRSPQLRAAPRLICRNPALG